MATTRFLNVDLDVEGGDDLAVLTAALSEVAFNLLEGDVGCERVTLGAKGHGPRARGQRKGNRAGVGVELVITVYGPEMRLDRFAVRLSYCMPGRISATHRRSQGLVQSSARPLPFGAS